MKKLFAILMSALMIISVSASGAFVSSPSANLAPEVVGFINETEDCTATVVCTAYADREELKEETRETLEEAYETVVESADLSVLVEEVEEIATEIGIDVENLAVSDMFDISTSGCDVHIEHGRFVVTLKPTSVKNFVCLLHYHDAEWNVVEDAEIDEDGNLTFSAEGFSPFAIVVELEKDAESINWLWIVIAVICALIIFFIIWKKSKKDKEGEENTAKA